MANVAGFTPRVLALILLTLSLLVSGGVAPVRAERGHGYDHDRYFSPHWELDVRHHHDHFYPARGYVVPALPPGYLDLTFRGRRYFFRSGVWFGMQGPGFVVVRPPVGIRLALLPPSYSTLWIGGVPYYYANGIYYTPVPNSSEYVVVNPPPGYETAAPQSGQVPAPTLPLTAPANPQGATPQPSVPQSLFVYPREGQTQTQITGDRSDCNEWAIGQTGYDPAHPGTAGSQRAGDFQRAVRTCLEGKGYTVN
jgi:uncharacterized protein DUF6515